MIRKYFSAMGYSLLIAGCNNAAQDTVKHQETSKTQTESAQPVLLKLGNLEQCQQYNGLPPDWLKNPHAGMVWIPAGSFELGSALAYPDEQNMGEKKNQVQGYWMDQTEVTVAQFRSFVDATHYITDAEKQHEAAVFTPDIRHPQQWWQLKSGYTWKTPNGAKTKAPHPAEPVRYVTQNDAAHYAAWLNRDLPTETEWEYAAKAHSAKDTPLHEEPRDHQHAPVANYWQGKFPFENLNQDHFQGIAPVGCYPANAFKLHDMIGNVWEWTSSPYTGAHHEQDDNHMGNYRHLRHQQIQAVPYAIKGGSFLCASNYCARYRNSSRHPQETDLATTHTGFRTIERHP